MNPDQFGITPDQLDEIEKLTIQFAYREISKTPGYSEYLDEMEGVAPNAHDVSRALYVEKGWAVWAKDIKTLPDNDYYNQSVTNLTNGKPIDTEPSWLKFGDLFRIAAEAGLNPIIINHDAIKRSFED